jgi:CheY-like chemotaxis protein
VGKLLLESQGYEVLLAGGGFEGLVAFKQALPDIIISDLVMPNMITANSAATSDGRSTAKQPIEKRDQSNEFSGCAARSRLRPSTG